MQGYQVFGAEELFSRPPEGTAEGVGAPSPYIVSAEEMEELVGPTPPPTLGQRATRAAKDVALQPIDFGLGLLSGSSQILGPQRVANTVGDILGVNGERVPDTGEQLGQMIGVQTPEEGPRAVARRFGQGAGGILAGGPVGPESQAAKVTALGGAGSVLSYGAEKAGLPWYVQMGAGLLPFVFGAFTPNKLGKNAAKGPKAPKSGAELSPQQAAKQGAAEARAEVIRDGKAAGMTEKGLTPLIGGPKAFKMFQTPGGRAKALERTEQEIHSSYRRIEDQLAKAAPLPPVWKFYTAYHLRDGAQKLKQSPGRTAGKVATQRLMEEEAATISQSKKFTGSNVWEMYKAGNEDKAVWASQYGQAYKDWVMGLVEKISPAAAKNLRITNGLNTQLEGIKATGQQAGKFLTRIEERLMLRKIADAKPTAAIGQGLKWAGLHQLRELYTSAAYSPRFQNLATKFVQALEEGKTAVAQDLAQRMYEDLEKTDARKRRAESRKT